MQSDKSRIFTVLLILCTIISLCFYSCAPDSSDQSDLNIAEQNAVSASDTTNAQREDMIVAGGCFWCVEADMEKAPGVIEVISGYSGGQIKNPDYDNYAEGGHREVARVIYNPEQVSYKGLLYYFIKHIDPTDAEGSFTDRGKQYSPAIYYETEEEKKDAREVLADIAQRNVFEEELKVPVLPEEPFWMASEYHQDYYKDDTVQYTIYRKFSGRSSFIEEHWGEQADVIPDSLKQ
ncbi:peptide-methionine (S)-S-oxide reductase MsrA [Rhodohalobacter sp. 8-1]|uniref:peptide-methionine (S)-S-oxide reductase MsrA n=1 Tax=Rhodohalobacter sp. 8-1 TaxID=3131972 RepID=UPI0030EB1717